MAQTRAEVAVMASTAAKFDQANAALQTMLTTLMSELSALNDAWRGLGATAFEHVRSQYAADLKNLNDALAETAEAIRSAGASYQLADDEAAARLSRAAGSLTLPL